MILVFIIIKSNHGIQIFILMNVMLQLVIMTQPSYSWVVSTLFVILSLEKVYS